MVKPTAQKVVCESCGAEVREGSAFCYNCGTPVELEPLPPAIIRPDPELLNGSPTEREPGRAFRDPEPPPVSAPVGNIDTPPPKPSAKTEAFPRTSAETLRRPKARVKKAPEVVYSESASSAGAFIVAAVVLALIAGLLVAAGLYLQ